jgi:hypothetical protein
LSVMHWRNNINDRADTFGQNSVPSALSAAQISHRIAQDQTRVSGMKGPATNGLGGTRY